MTLLKQTLPATLKAATAQLVDHAGGTQVSAIVGKSMLGNYADPQKPNYFIRGDVIAELEAKARRPIVTEWLAMQQGCLLVPLHDDDALPLPLALARVTNETGKLLSAGSVALRDTRCSETEIARIEEEALKVASACASLLADCRAARKANDNG